MEQRNTPPLQGMNTSPSGRKRPRTDKPPSNLYGEKRRREQETSSYMEQLVELITANISNPESQNMKTDKVAPLIEKWKQMNRMKDQQQEMEQQGSEVQHSQVSSSKPGMLSGDSLESVLLQTLDGFLFVVNMSNNKAEIEYVSSNIQSFLNYKQEELIGKSIYNFIHVGDHNHSISCLVPNSSSAGGMWKDHRSFNCRMQIKCDDPGGMNQETRYENMKCSAMLKPATDKDGESSSSAEGESTSHLYVIAQRALDDDRGTSSSSSGQMLPVIEEMTMEMDMNCCIIAVDTSKVKPPYHSKDEMISQPIYKYCYNADRTEMRKYFDEVKEKGSSTSALFSFQLYNEVWVYIQMNSHIRKNQHTGQTEIVAVHSIIRDPELSNRLKLASSTGGQHTTTTRVLEALESRSSKPGGLHTATVNQLTRIMMKRQQQQQAAAAAQVQKQQQSQGLGYSANNMNNVHHQERLMQQMHPGRGGMMGTPPLPDRTNNYPQSLNPYNQVVNPVNSMNNAITGSGVTMPPSLEPSTLAQIPSSSGSHHVRGVSAPGEFDDNDVFIPGAMKVQIPSSQEQSKVGGGSSDKRKSVDNPSPDTNADKEFLQKNYLLSKLLEDDDTNIENVEDEKDSSPTSSASSSALSRPKQPAKLVPHRKDVLDNNLLQTMLKEESIRQHQASDAGAKKQEQKDRARATSQSTLLAGMLDGDNSKMFGSGKLPTEQAGFISSTIVSTTTALRKASESGDERRGEGSKEAAKKPKKKNELLEKLLREEDDPSSSDQRLIEKQCTSQGSPNKDATTSPTVTSTKPQLPRMDPASTLLDEETSEDVIQQIIRAANSLPDDIGANNPNLIVDILKEFDNEVERDFVNKYLSPDNQMTSHPQQQQQRQGNPPPPNYDGTTDQSYANMNNMNRGPSYSGANMGAFGGPIPPVGNMAAGLGNFQNFPTGGPRGMMQGSGANQGTMNKGTPPQHQQQQQQPFVSNTGENRMYPQQGKNVAAPLTGMDKMKDKPQSGVNLPGGDEDIIQQLEQVLNSGDLDMNLPTSSAGPATQDGFNSLWNSGKPASGPTASPNMTPQNMPNQSMSGFTPGTPAVSSSGPPQSQPMVPTAGVGGPQQNPLMEGSGGMSSMPGNGGGMVSSSMMMGTAPQPTRFQAPTGANGRQGYVPNMSAGQMQPSPIMQQQSMPGQGMGAHQPEGQMTRQPNQLKQAIMMKSKQRWQEQQQRNMQQQQQQQQQQMMQQQQMRMQQQKNLMMLQQKQQQQTFPGPQMEGQMFNSMDTQAYPPTKLTEMLNPSTNMAAPNVSIQKANMPFTNQMGNFSNHPMQPGGSMGPRPMHHGMPQQYPQGNPSARPSPDYGPQFGQMMPQNRGMAAGYQGPQHGMTMGGYHGPDFSGGMGPGGNMGGGMNTLPGMMHGGMGQMGAQHPGMSMSPGMGGNPMSQVPGMNPSMRPSMRPGGMGSRMGTPQLNRSMSMPQSSMNPYQMQGTPQNNYANFGAPGNPNMGMRQPGMGAAAMSRQASMPETMNTNMRWNGGAAGNMQNPYNGGGAMPASSMAANQFGGPGGGGSMDMMQNMMQQRGPMQGQQMGHANMGNIPTSTTMNASMQQPPNQQGGFPGGQGNPQLNSSTTNNSAGSFPSSGVTPASGAGGGMQPHGGGSTELEKMMNFGNFGASSSSMPPQANTPDSSGNARRNQIKMAQNQAHKQARSRFQELCKVSNARDAPDASTRATNLFRNQLMGMAPNLSQNAGNVTPTLLPTSAGSNQQRMAQENMDQNSGEGQDDGSKHSLLQKLLSST